jgi:hypothetical protein
MATEMPTDQKSWVPFRACSGSPWRSAISIGRSPLQSAARRAGKAAGRVPVVLRVRARHAECAGDARTAHRPKGLYFTVKDLDAVFERSRELHCLSTELVHGAPAGQLAVRPWGERSFYAEDPWGNPLYFVQEDTVYAG